MYICLKYVRLSKQTNVLVTPARSDVEVLEIPHRLFVIRVGRTGN